LALPPAVAQVQSPPENLIHVEIAGLHNDKGQVLCSLFSSAADFPKRAEKAVAHARSGIVQGHASCEFPGVAVCGIGFPRREFKRKDGY
jgi:uncharacterized protein (DUF2141 family)